MPSRLPARLALACACAGLLAPSARSQTHPPRSQFKATVVLGNLSDPTQMAFLPDGRLYLLNIKGNIQIVDPKTGQATPGGTIPTSNVHEDGLHSLVLDPAFATNRRVYALFGTQQPKPAMVVARFVAQASGALDISSRKDLLTVEVLMGQSEEHTTGCLAFGPDGNLFVSFADNTRNIFSGTGMGYAPRDPRRPEYDAQRSAANSNDLRGKILRIRPEEDGTYTVPDGNLFAKGEAKTRPEIYVMGLRHPFRITVDQKTGWLFWAEPGPNASQDNANQGPRGYEEVNLAKDPGNYGWPYCIANNFCYTQFDYAAGTGGAVYNPASLTNSSANNTGIAALPAARPALIWYPYNSNGTAFPIFGSGTTNTGMLGPVYRYDAANPSTAKLPPYFDGRLVLFDFSRSLIHTVKLDEAGKVDTVERLWDQSPSNALQNPIDCKVGPDGALYFLAWGNNGSYPHNAGTGSLVRLEYTGPSTPARPAAARTASGNGWVLLAPGERWAPPSGIARAEAYDPRGRIAWTWTPGSGHPVPEAASQMLRVRFVAAK